MEQYHSLFPDEERLAANEYVPPVNGSLFGAFPEEKTFTTETLEQFREIPLSLLIHFPEWGRAYSLLQRLKCETLHDAATLRLEVVTQKVGLQARSIAEIRRFQEELKTNAERYVTEWEERMKPVVLSLAPWSDLPTALASMHAVAMQAAEIWCKRHSRGELISEYLRQGRTLADFDLSKYKLTRERLRQIVNNALGGFFSGKPIEGVSLLPDDCRALAALFSQSLYHCFPVALLTPIDELFFSFYGQSVVAPTNVDSTWDFFVVVGQNEIIPLRRLLTVTIATLSRIQLPASADEVVERVRAYAADVPLPEAQREHFVRSMLLFHPWVERLGEDTYRLATTRLLRVVERLARIIFDRHAPIKNTELLSLYERTYGERARSTNLSRLQAMWKGYVAHGRTGYLEYDPKAERSLSLNQQVRLWLKDGSLPPLFRLNDVHALMEQCGLKTYNDATVRSYLSISCVTSLDDDELFCQNGHEAEYPEHRWRQRVDTKAGTRLAEALYDFLLLHPNHEVYLRELNDYALQVTDDEDRKSHSYVVTGVAKLITDTEAEAVAQRRPFFRVQRYGMDYVKLNERFTRDDCASISARRHFRVIPIHDALYAFARMLLARPEHRDGMRLSVLVRLFAESPEYASHQEDGEASSVRLRAAFNEGVLPKDFRRVTQTGVDGRNAVFIQLATET